MGTRLRLYLTENNNIIFRYLKAFLIDSNNFKKNEVKMTTSVTNKIEDVVCSLEDAGQKRGKSETQIISIPAFILAVLLMCAGTIGAFMDKKMEVLSAIYGAATICFIFSSIGIIKKFKTPLGEAEMFESFRSTISSQTKDINSIQEKQRIQSQDIDLIQIITLTGIISKHEVKHLSGLIGEKEYLVQYNTDIRDEIRRLDKFGFILPSEGKGLDTLDKEFGEDLNKYYSKDKKWFNLKNYIQITKYGKEYMNLYNKVGLSDRDKL
jgi:hypothetical protein